MRGLLVAAFFALVVSAGLAFAGPNEDLVLVVQGNVDGAETDGDPCTSIVLPGSCSDLTPTAIPDLNGVEWFLILAAREPEPLGFTTITFGVGNYNPDATYIALFGPCNQAEGPLEIPSDDWPFPEEGTSVSWAPSCLEGNMVPVYYFGIYAYGDGTIPLGDYYPGQPSGVVSCTDPPVEDVFIAYGTLGVGGAQGYNPDCTIPNPARRTTWGQIKAVYQ